MPIGNRFSKTVIANVTPVKAALLCKSRQSQAAYEGWQMRAALARVTP